MPSRFVSLLILGLWLTASVALFSRDVLPGLVVGDPPDMRAIARESEASGPTCWAILVADPDREQEETEPLNLKAVGRVETEAIQQADGCVRLESHAWFDAGQLLSGTPLATADGDRIVVQGVCDIDHGGSLDRFRVGMRMWDTTDDLVVISGKVVGNRLEVTAEGPPPLFHWKRAFAYQAHGMVQNALGPMDRLPGLQVGQTWGSRIVNPLTGRVEEVQVEVVRRRYITWDSNPVSTFELVTRSRLMTSRTWVRTDGLVLKQEVPFPFVRLYLERQPEEASPLSGNPSP